MLECVTSVLVSAFFLSSTYVAKDSRSTGLNGLITSFKSMVKLNFTLELSETLHVAEYGKKNRRLPLAVI